MEDANRTSPLCLTQERGPPFDIGLLRCKCFRSGRVLAWSMGSIMPIRSIQGFKSALDFKGGSCQHHFMSSRPHSNIDPRILHRAQLSLNAQKSSSPRRKHAGDVSINSKLSTINSPASDPKPHKCDAGTTTMMLKCDAFANIAICSGGPSIREKGPNSRPENEKSYEIICSAVVPERRHSCRPLNCPHSPASRANIFFAN